VTVAGGFSPDTFAGFELRIPVREAFEQATLAFGFRAYF
jgi:hypothetical protein